MTHEHLPTPHPRRRDLHRTARTRIPRIRPLSGWDRRVLFGAPATLLLAALSAGLFTGTSASADASHAPQAAATAAAELPAAPTPTPAAVAEAPAAVADARAALARAEQLTSELRTIKPQQRKRIESLSDELRALMAERSDAAASRAGERRPIEDARASDETPAPAPEPSSDAASDTPSAAPAGDEGAGSGPQAEVMTEPATKLVVAAPPAELAAPSLPDQDAPLADADTTETEGAETDSAAPSATLAAPAVATATVAAAEVKEATEALTELVRSAEASAVKITPAPLTAREVLARQVQASRKAAPKLAKLSKTLAGHENGQIPGRRLCTLAFARGETLRCDAAQQLERLNRAYHARFGGHLEINDSYRSFAAQVATAATRGFLAAVPGYSNHGWAVAVDLSGMQFGNAKYEWLRKHGPSFGWDNPGWARAGGRKPEPWHWEYKAR